MRAMNYAADVEHRDVPVIVREFLARTRCAMTIGVRQAAPGDEATLRAVRIEALEDAPEAFGSTLERELARTPEDWRRWMFPGAVFILYNDGRARGLVAGAAREDDPLAIQLMAMWVHPSLRGTGNLLPRWSQPWSTGRAVAAPVRSSSGS